jgi:hypothetical protein
MNAASQRAMMSFNANLQQVPGVAGNPTEDNQGRGLVDLARSLGDLHDTVDRLTKELEYVRCR